MFIVVAMLIHHRHRFKGKYFTLTTHYLRQMINNFVSNMLTYNLDLIEEKNV